MRKVNTLPILDIDLVDCYRRYVAASSLMDDVSETGNTDYHEIWG
jgi:hypothetical protein